VESSQQNHNSLDSSINRKEGGELEIKQVFLIHDATTSNLDTNSFLVNQSSFLVNQSLMANLGDGKGVHRPQESCNMEEFNILEEIDQRNEMRESGHFTAKKTISKT
jgi:hypothetical protein